MVGVTFSTRRGVTFRTLLTILTTFAINGSSLGLILRVTKAAAGRSFTSVMGSLKRFCVFNSCKCILLCILIKNIVKECLGRAQRRDASNGTLRFLSEVSPKGTYINVTVYCALALLVRQCRRTARNAGLAISGKC